MGHPEVYIVILPAFGIYSEIIPTFARKRLFGHQSMVWATAGIAFLKFLQFGFTISSQWVMVR
ncbi:cbb3-type cytochrome c oxidase subunit I [Staphylococcus aureus]|nr:cbb3-type cytochrome c oxidase subunit I [Staphylococcus aureus]